MLVMVRIHILSVILRVKPSFVADNRAYVKDVKLLQYLELGDVVVGYPLLIVTNTLMRAIHNNAITMITHDQD